MEKLLEVSDLHVAFPSKRETVRAVDGVSFQVFQGETFGLVGESGCGKSQTLRSILGLLKQPGRITGGAIRYKGADIAKMSQRELQKIRGKEISMIFQEPMTALNPVLRIRSQMYEAFEGEKLSKEEKRRRAIELLKLVGIPSPETRLDEYPHQFSGGMRPARHDCHRPGRPAQAAAGRRAHHRAGRNHPGSDHEAAQPAQAGTGYEHHPGDP